MDDRSDSSSPDPLGYPGNPEYILSSATKPFLQRQISFSPQKSLSPGRRLSPSKADGRSAQSIRFQDIVLPSTPSGRFTGKHRLSPTKTTTLTSENNTSPWRIRVTVEAEQDEGDENFLDSVRSGTKSRRGKTTKVPLKDENGSLEPSPKRRRTGTSDLSQRVPTPRKPRTKVQTPTRNTGTTEKRKRGRPRKIQPSVEEGNVVNNVTFADSVRKKMREEDPFLDIATDDKGTDDVAVNNTLADISDSHSMPEFIEPNSNDGSSPTPTGRNKPRNPDSRFKVVSPVADDPTSFTSSPFSPRLHTGLTPENTIDAGHTPGPHVRGYPTPTSSSLLEEGAVEIPTGHSSDTKKQQSGSITQPLGDPTTQHREFDSILESEGFSMVSLDTLPSARQQLNNSLQRAVNQGMINSTNKAPKKEMLSTSKSEAQHVRPSASGPSDKENVYISPQSRPMSQSSRQQRRSSQQLHPNPGEELSSPQHPPTLAIQPPRPVEKTRLAKLVRVIRTGIALQGVLDRRRRNSRLESPFSNPGHPRIDDSEAARQRLDALFQGFGIETQRELRAGLRFGEELAKRLRESESKRKREEPESVAETPQAPAVFTISDNNNNRLGYPDIGSSVSKRVSQHSVWTQAKSDLDGKTAQLTSTPSDKNQSPQRPISSEMARREGQWQRERDAISRQIQQANSSQVIVIDSDDGSPAKNPPGNEEVEELQENDPVDEEDYEDIWQQEARDTESQSETASFVELNREEIIKPPRRVLPTPWKRNEEADPSQDEEATPGPQPYWTTRQNEYAILPSGKSQTARFREQNAESSSLLGSPESATRRFYQGNKYTPEITSRRFEQTEGDKQYARNSNSSSSFSGSHRRSKTSYSDDEASDADVIHPSWAPSPESRKNDTGNTSPDHVDTYSELPMNDGNSYPELPSGSVRSSRNSPGREEINSESESQNATPRAGQDDQKPPTTESESSTREQQDAPLSWFHKLTDLAPTWLTTPASRKVERRQLEPVSDSTPPETPIQEPSAQSSPVQRSADQKSPIQRSPVQSSPIEIAPILNSELSFRESGAQEYPFQKLPTKEPQLEAGPPHQLHRESIKRMTVDTGTQFSSPPIAKRKPQIRQPPSQHKALAISGYFTDDHYAALRHLYHEAKQSPGSFPYIETPHRNEMLGQRIYSADGVYSRRITEMQIAIVDKFRRDLSVDSRRRGGTGKVEWSETELLRRLFSIIVGEQVRRERKRDLEHQFAGLYR
ncbi:hypothetical protein AJ78_06241 [Emergomyces pasteurianus Ep9510]|uniref:AT DNA binding protein n=1 Tax=Emergomyces pasteurianus Ep9510 TaxID=1447872 RepID=A0A1J9P9N5_9EURO|nr:hypothetical protein AJ78_06241 [Emergomyces pasteurianus Ep9510]